MKKTALITIICVSLVLVNIVESFGQSKLNHVIHETTISSNLSNCQVYASSTDLSKPVTISFVITAQRPASTATKNSIANGIVSLIIPESAEVDYDRIVVYGGREDESTTLERFNPDNNTDKIWTSIASYILSWTPIGPVIGTGDFMQQMDEIIRSNSQVKPKFDMNEYDQIDIPFDPPFNKYARIQADFIVSFADNTEIGVGASWEILGHNNSGKLLSDPKDYKGFAFDQFDILDRCVLEQGTFTDSRDGNVYKWIKIGNQTWMAENLAYLPAVSSSNQESDYKKHYYVYGYEGNSVSIAKTRPNYRVYGVLYNWPAAVNIDFSDRLDMYDGRFDRSAGRRFQGACPAGWHLPSDGEWRELEAFLGGRERVDYQGVSILGITEKLKSSSGWDADSGNGNNSSRFNILPAGRMSSEEFSRIGWSSRFWTSTLGGWNGPSDRIISDDYYSYGPFANTGSSVRCVKGE